VSSARVTPWWRSMKLRKEITDASGQLDDVQMSLFQAVYGTTELRPAYADPSYYGEITHPTQRLIGLLSQVAVRLGGGRDYTRARALTHLNQGMGGGKSHACIGCYHLASSPRALARTDLGKAVFAQAGTIIGRELAADLNRPHVVILPCDNMTPGAPVQEHDGPAVNLFERFLWRLFSKDYALYERYAPYFNDKSKITEALRAVHRPVLIVIDEIMDYLGNGLDGASKPDLAAQDMGFVRALLDVVNDVPHVAMVVVMIGSETMALSQAGAERRSELHGLLERNGKPGAVTANADFADILRRRLFEQTPAAEVLEATAKIYDRVMSDRAWSKGVWDSLAAPRRNDFYDEVARTYPFHPQLMNLAEKEWAEVSGFQRVRSTIQIFAATAFALQQRGRRGEWVPILIGAGDLPLSDSTVREAVLGSGLIGDERTIVNFRALAENNIVNQSDDGGAARRLDLDRDPVVWSHVNPRAAERGATLIFLTSIVGARPGGRRGASAPEVKAATAVPDTSYVLADADGVVEDLANQDRGMSAIEVIPGQGHNKPARYYLSTKLNYRMIVTTLRRSVTDRERDEVLARLAEELSNSGPFRKKIFVAADPDSDRSATDVLAAAGIDDARTTRLVILDPAQFSLRNGTEQETLAALEAVSGLGAERLAVEWASSAVYVIINTRQRALARGLAADYLARERALKRQEVQADEDLKATGTKELAESRDKLKKAIRRAYQHVVFLAQPDPTIDRALDQVTFEDEHDSALDGTLVWKALTRREKVFDDGQFTARALLHNLREQDYGRPLSEIRDAFWNAPRLPLLHGGEKDLQHAIYQAVQQGELRIVGSDNSDVVVTDPGQVNLSSSTLQLARPIPATGTGQASERDGEWRGGDAHGSVDVGSRGGTATTVSGAEASGDEELSGGAPPAEKYVTFPLPGTLLDAPDKVETLARIFRTLYSILDDGQVSYMQGSLQIVLDAAAVERLAKQVRALGLTVTIRDQ
jgi:Protein of unknown function (DUF499)